MKGILSSRKAMLGLLALVFYAVVLIWPETRDIADKIAPVLASIVGLVVFGITIEDSVKWWAERPADLAQAVSSLAQEIIAAINEGREVPPSEPPANA